MNTYHNTNVAYTENGRYYIRVRFVEPTPEKYEPANLAGFEWLRELERELERLKHLEK